MNPSPMIPTAEIAWRRVAWIAMGLMQSVGEVGTSSYRMLAQLHGRVQYFGFANTLALSVALYFLPRLRGVPVTSVRT